MNAAFALLPPSVRSETLNPLISSPSWQKRQIKSESSPKNTKFTDYIEKASSYRKPKTASHFVGSKPRCHFSNFSDFTALKPKSLWVICELRKNSICILRNKLIFYGQSLHKRKRAKIHKTIDPIKLEEARTLSPALKNLAVGLTQLGSAVQVSQEPKCNALASPQKPCLRDRRVIPAR